VPLPGAESVAGPRANTLSSLWSDNQGLPFGVLRLKNRLRVLRMAANSLPRLALPLLLPIRGWWQGLERARKLTVALSVGVVCGVLYVCSFVANHIEQAFGHKAAASTALYMDSFVEPLVQELAVKASLSADNRQALERLLSPASIGKPVVAFRIWVGDRVVFSNRSDMVGRRFPTSARRERAFQGDVVANFELDGEEEAQERALHTHILEVYAPVRQTGTNRIIALAEISELAVDLVREIRAAQYASYVVIASAAIGLLLVLFSLTDGLQMRIGELALQRDAHEQFRRRVLKANGRVLEMNERNLRRVGRELHAGPLQLAALALLKLDALSEPPSPRAETAATRAADIDVIRKALKECLRQIRDVSAGLAPSEIESLSLAEAISTAVCLYELRTGAAVDCEFRELPQEAAYPLKACLYQLIEEGLAAATRHRTAGGVHVSAVGGETLKIDIGYETEFARASAWLTDDLELKSERVRHQIEALGGTLSLQSPADRQVRISASFGLGDMGNTNV
jgi:signal transduction histidine kinase